MILIVIVDCFNDFISDGSSLDEMLLFFNLVLLVFFLRFVNTRLFLDESSLRRFDYILSQISQVFSLFLYLLDWLWWDDFLTLRVRFDTFLIFLVTSWLELVRLCRCLSKRRLIIYDVF